VISSSPLHDEKENIIGIMGIIHDVTETRDLEEKLKNEERLASLGRLATGVAHEIRNPLSSVKMNIAILRERLKPKGTDIEHFKIAEDEVVNLERIVTELIDYAKPAPLRIRKEDIYETTESTLAVAETFCLERNVIIEKKFAKNLPRIPMDKAKIHQAVLNVLLNAIQASKPGNKIELKTEVHSPSNSIRIIAIDQGHGIEKKNIKYIFDPFFTTKKEGTGLGLSIVRNIIKNHNGNISLDSNLGKGTRVCIELPIE
jgi:signal transduction histidine kinase